MAGGIANTVVFRSKALVAADKPAGMLTVPSRMGAEDARPCFGRELEKALGCRLWPVHRLDVDVSGLVVFALDAEAHRIAGELFEERQVRKTYAAVTDIGLAALPGGGRFPVDFRWENRLFRGKKRSFVANHGNTAITVAQCLGYEKGSVGPDRLLRWRLFPETGRPHQLRVHLSLAGFPIVGDVLYGSQRKWGTGLQGMALRAVALEILDEGARAQLGMPKRLEVDDLESF